MTGTRAVMQPRRGRWTGLLLALPVLVSLACNTVLGGAASTPGGAPTAAPGQPTPVVTQAGEPTSASTTAPAETAAPLVLGPGAFNLLDAQTGLADLASYQATLTLTFAGTSNGASQQWRQTYVMLSNKQPAARQVTIEKHGDLEELAPVFVAEVGGVGYDIRDQAGCFAAPFKPDEAPAQALEPAGLLTGVIGADEAGTDTVNDVPANHYTFDERALALQDLAQSTGELWVAADGGYILKYVLKTTGGADYFGAGTDGILTWDYELTQVNQPVAITLPADCPAGRVTAPRLPDAANVQDTPGQLAYDSTSSLADAVTFYQTQLPDQGWQLAGDPIAAADLPADQPTVIMDFTQAGQTLTVILAAGETGTQVRVAQGGAQK